MKVLAWSPNLTPQRCEGTAAEYAAKETLLRASDVVTIHVRLGEATRSLIARPEFESMKDSACLINTSRGPIVDEAALVAALESRRDRRGRGWTSSASSLCRGITRCAERRTRSSRRIWATSPWKTTEYSFDAPWRHPRLAGRPAHQHA